MIASVFGDVAADARRARARRALPGARRRAAEGRRSGEVDEGDGALARFKQRVRSTAGPSSRVRERASLRAHAASPTQAMPSVRRPIADRRRGTSLRSCVAATPARSPARRRARHVAPAVALAAPHAIAALRRVGSVAIACQRSHVLCAVARGTACRTPASRPRSSLTGHRIAVAIGRASASSASWGATAASGAARAARPPAGQAPEPRGSQRRVRLGALGLARALVRAARSSPSCERAPACAPTASSTSRARARWRPRRPRPEASPPSRARGRLRRRARAGAGRPVVPPCAGGRRRWCRRARAACCPCWPTRRSVVPLPVPVLPSPASCRCRVRRACAGRAGLRSVPVCGGGGGGCAWAAPARRASR